MGFVKLTRSSTTSQSVSVSENSGDQATVLTTPQASLNGSDNAGPSSSDSQLVVTAAATSSTSRPCPSNPNQPTRSYLFPATKFGNAYRSFNSGWFEKFTWLHYCESTDAEFCWYCMMHAFELKSSKRDVAFITRGFRNWRHATEAFRKHEHSDGHKEAIEVHLLPQQCHDISEVMQKNLREEKQLNRDMLIIILRSVKYLARQGLALRGHSSTEGNFFQLMKLQGETDSNLRLWLQKKHDKYISGEIQNEILRVMAHDILRKIANSIHENTYYTLMADEVTDSSNREQFVVCLRWVNKETFEVNEDLIGMYQVDNIASMTLYSSLKDILLRLNLSIQNCRGQCYDGASNMVGIRSGVATLIKNEEPRATLVHCYGHSLQLAVSDTVKQIKTMSDALDTTNEISKLLKYSPKRDTLFHKLKQDLAPHTPGFRVLCPTRWTVRANSLQSVIDNWEPLHELWEECLCTRLDSEVKSRIIGVKYQMQTFQYFFGTSLGVLLMSHSDNLSRTLQHTFMSAVEAQSISAMTVKTLQLMRSDTQFDMFWANVNHKATALEVSEPSLPRKRKRPVRYEDGEASPEFPDSVKSFYRSIYFNSLDVIITCIQNRFDQPGYTILSQLEAVLLKAINNEEYSEELHSVCKFYKEEINSTLVKNQLDTLSATIYREINADSTLLTFKELKAFMSNLTTAQKSLLSEVVFMYTMILIAPASNAVSERSCSALRRTKTWLRTTMCQERLNHCLILHTHQSRTDDLNLLSIASEFVEGNESRLRIFGLFK